MIHKDDSQKLAEQLSVSQQAISPTKDGKDSESRQIGAI